MSYFFFTCKGQKFSPLLFLKAQTFYLEVMLFLILFDYSERNV